MAKVGLFRNTGIIFFVVYTATAISASAQSFTTLFSFDNTNGAYPTDRLTQSTDGSFYGTAEQGGAYGYGTVFKITTAGKVTTLHSFNSADGAYPYAGLIQATDGNFYGTTGGGGTNSGGTVFRITPEGTLTTLYSFCSQTNCTDGNALSGALVQATDGNFYGTTHQGGASNLGTVFKISPGGSVTTLHNFSVAEDGGPFDGLIQATDGNFYGTTLGGTVFKITPGGTLITLHKFDKADGQLVYAGLVQAKDGSFYGTACAGGDNGFGTVFTITAGGLMTTLYNFDGTHGRCPQARLVQAADGNFYGTTEQGGGHGSGTIFEMTPGGTLTTVYRFCSQTNCLDGFQPEAALIQAADGNFYGTAVSGGKNNIGTVFSFGPAAVTLLPTALSFVQAVNQTSAAKTVTLTNSGTTLLTVNGVNISGDFAISANTCDGAALTMGTRCRVSVTFTPPSLGMETGTLTVTDNASNSPQTVPLSGTGVEPATLIPSGVFLGTWAVGTTSAPKTFILTNHESVPLSGITVSTTGDFAISGTTCTTSLDASRNCTISITFTATTTGTRTGTLTVSDSANNSPQAAILTGTGTLPATLVPTSAAFGTWAVGTTSSTKTFTLANYETVPLTNVTLTTSGDFAVSATTCTTSLLAQSKCTISVTFTPTATGTRTGTLTINDSASNRPQTSPLTGTGVLPTTLTPANASFGTWTVGTTGAAKTFTLTNNQRAELISISLSTTGDFAVSATTCTTSLAAQSRCTVDVTFTPTAKGTRTGRLNVSDSANNSPQTSNLTGVGK